MKANKPMTGEQLDELMTVAVNMQRVAETDCNRPSAMFAYAVQVAVLELRKVRNDAATLAAENAGLKVANAEGCKWDGEQWVGISIETPATDAFLAEVRAQGVEMAVDVVKHCYDNICAGGLQENREYEESIVQPHLDGIDDELKEIIAQLRKGVQS
ncbi:hypothetical protein [Enterobacter roggenkampii]|uniref:hypothetical protein n=1 Tax=Enterobacter roggenkampii TaxID=1812935 RepID=UPI00194EDA37|nr:hypothetical protein [Enterobacter roggenkampii]